MGKIHKKLGIGSKIKITNENYKEDYPELYKKKCIVTDICTSENDCYGYDSTMQGQALVDCKDLKTGKDIGSSFYEYEFDVLD